MQGVLVFEAAGARLAVSVGDVLRLVMEPAVTAVPFGHPALAGIMANIDGVVGVVPVFDLRGLAAGAVPPQRHVEGATVAVIPTPQGPIGLRLDKLLGTAARYVAAGADQGADGVAAHLDVVIDGYGVADDSASLSVGTAPFAFFSTDAFVAILDVATG
jgi:hypothetical protein